MKNTMSLSLAGIAVLALSGCSNNDSGCHDDCYVPEPLEIIYFLHTYDDVLDRFEGVEGVYYECDSGYEGFTEYDGAYFLLEGDYCVFYDLDDTLSYEYDVLYMSETLYGDFAIPSSDYQCDSGWYGSTGNDGSFIFDPEYYNLVGDVCGFDFYY